MVKKFFVKQEFYWRKKIFVLLRRLSIYMLCNTYSFAALAKKEALHIINHCFSRSACIDVKDATNDPRRNYVYCCWKTRSCFSQAAIPKEIGGRQQYKLSVSEKVLLQALVESDKSPLIFPQETLLKSFCRLYLLRWLLNWNMDLWSFPCWHNINDADLAKDNLIVSRTRKWWNL